MARRGMSAFVPEARFMARPPWWGADLQTLRNALVGRAIGLDDYPFERIEFGAADGSGDKLLGALNRPAGEAPPKPLVLLLHGMTGSEDSAYMRASARHFLGQGYPVLRLNLRGAGPSRPLCRGQYHAGRSEDLRAVLGQMDGRLAGNGLLMVGFSLGGNILLRYLGEAGPLAPVVGAAVVSAPIDLKAAQSRLMAWRNRFYHRHILAQMKAEISAPASDLGDDERRAVARARSVLEVDDRVIAPRNGFAGAEDYYARCSANAVVMRIRVPTLVIQARNDPWIPFRSFAEVEWGKNPKLVPLFPASGGHVGFHALDGSTPWHDRRAAAFFAALSR